jgi:hypothetical protein
MERPVLGRELRNTGLTDLVNSSRRRVREGTVVINSNTKIFY